MTQNKRKAEVQKELAKRGISDAPVPEGAPEPKVREDKGEVRKQTIISGDKEITVKVVWN